LKEWTGRLMNKIKHFIMISYSFCGVIIHLDNYEVKDINLGFYVRYN